MILTILYITLLQTNHGAIITWDSSPSASANPSLTYNIRRANMPCTSSPLVTTQIGSTAAGVLTFTDTTPLVTPSTCYEVRAVLAGQESLGAFGVVAIQVDLQPPSNVKGSLVP